MPSCSPFVVPCGRPLCARCQLLRRERNEALKRTGLVLCAFAAVLLFAFAGQCEEPADERRPVVLDVGEGVVCKVPGLPAAVPLPPGKMVPTEVWLRLDRRFRELEAEAGRERAIRVETERQVTERIAQAIAWSLAIGVAAGVAGAWIVQKPPW